MKGSNGSAFDPGTASLDELAKALRSSAYGHRYADVLLGMLVALTITGVALWFLWDWLQRRITREKRDNTALILEKLDGSALKRVCGNVNLPAWVRYPDFERVQWVNELMSQLWPNAQAAAAAMVREQLDPMLKAYKPAWIYDIGIHTFTLGDRPPKISAVKVFSTDSVIDEVGLELECLWNGAQKFQLMMRPFPRIPIGAGIGAAISKLLEMRVGVGNLWFKGRVRIAMKPLLDRIPLVGAIKVSLVEAPDFAFSIDLQGGDITFLPGLEIWLAAFIKEAVLQPYVLPEGITIPLDSNAGRIEVPKGILSVKVVEAKNIPWLDWLTFPDPYVVIFARGRWKRKTKICRHSFNPWWEEEFLLLIHDIEHQDFNARVYDNDMIGADKEVGRVKVPIRDLPSGQTVDEWYALESPDVQRSGNPLQMGLRGVRSVSNVVRDTVHLPFCITQREAPQLRLQLTFHRIGETEVQAAVRHNDSAQAEESPIVRMLRGGVLILTVRKGVDEESFHPGLPSDKVTVTVAGQTKGTAATEGVESSEWEETLEFAVPGDVADGDDEQVQVRVWDYHWMDHDQVNMTWDGQFQEKEGVLHIPLKRIVDEQHIDDTFRLENVDGEVDLELRWIPMLDPNHSCSAA